MIAVFPAPPADRLSIGPLDLRFYGLMIAIGVLVGTWICGKMLERMGRGTADDASSIAVWGVFAGIIGARLYHVATEWPRFADDLGAIPEIWKGGLGIPGGLLAGILAGAWQAKRRGIEIPVGLTAAAPAIPVAQAIGRWGNWFNQELFGRPTDLPWALDVDADHLPRGYEVGTTFHPTFLYESLWNLGLAAVLWWVHGRFRPAPGRLMAMYLTGYGLGRFWIEGLRIDPTRASDVAGLRWNQWVALAAIAGGLIYLAATRGRTWPDDAEVADTGTSDAGTTSTGTTSTGTVDVEVDPADGDEHLDAGSSDHGAEPVAHDARPSAAASDGNADR